MKSKPQLSDALARCGRCADILPEATLTYCPACGVTFSEVPATQSYSALADRVIERAIRKEQFKWTALVGLFFVAVLLLQFLMAFSRQQRSIKNLGSLIRPLEIYAFDFENTPKLSNSVKRQAIGVALQAFEDHFSVPIKELSYRENKLPRDFEPLFSEIQNSLESFSVKASSLSFWEQKVYPQMTRKWAQNPLAPLPVIITNLPLYVDENSSSKIETRHLGKSRLISGLGHPAFVLVSTYRLHAEAQKDQSDIPKVKNDYEKSRFLGEYILAHELGHALLGLPDFVENPNSIRTPASEVFLNNCLMHTDAGGGFVAWDHLKKRDLGSASACSTYNKTKEALALREQSIALLQTQNKSQAKLMHKESLELLESHSSAWLTQLVQKEHFLFSNPLSYWWSEMFMVE